MQRYGLAALVALVAVPSITIAQHGSPTAPAAPNETGGELRGEALMQALRGGGYTIMLRHARTDRSVQEPMGRIPVERSEQRNLTEEGVQDARLMGVVLRKYQVPIGEILSSPMYRATETAELAAGTPKTTMELRIFPSTTEQAALVATPPRAGTNRLLVTHHFVIETHVPGIKPGDIGESEAAVIRVDGNGRVQLVGRIHAGGLGATGRREPPVAPAPVSTPNASSRR